MGGRDHVSVELGTVGDGTGQMDIYSDGVIEVWPGPVPTTRTQAIEIAKALLGAHGVDLQVEPGHMDRTAFIRGVEPTLDHHRRAYRLVSEPVEEES